MLEKRLEKRLVCHTCEGAGIVDMQVENLNGSIMDCEGVCFDCDGLGYYLEQAVSL